MVQTTGYTEEQKGQVRKHLKKKKFGHVLQYNSLNRYARYCESNPDVSWGKKTGILFNDLVSHLSAQQSIPVTADKPKAERATNKQQLKAATMRWRQDGAYWYYYFIITMCLKP